MHGNGSTGPGSAGSSILARADDADLFKTDYPRAIDRHIDYFGGSSAAWVRSGVGGRIRGSRRYRRIYEGRPGVL